MRNTRKSKGPHVHNEPVGRPGPKPTPPPDFENDQDEQRVKQLREIETALLEVKISLANLTGLAQPLTKTVETQCARVSQMREIEEATCSREAYLAKHGKMWT